MIKEKKLKNIIIIACTADVTEKNEDQCQKSLFDNIIFKPVMIKDLKKLISKYIWECFFNFKSNCFLIVFIYFSIPKIINLYKIIQICQKNNLKFKFRFIWFK